MPSEDAEEQEEDDADEQDDAGEAVSAPVRCRWSKVDGDEKAANDDEVPLRAPSSSCWLALYAFTPTSGPAFANRPFASTN